MTRIRRFTSEVIAAAVLPVFLLVALLFTTGCGGAKGDPAKENPQTKQTAAPVRVSGSAEGIRMISALPSREWAQPAGDFANTRFSTLDQINVQNVKNLHVVANTSTGIPAGHEGGPLYVNGTMYSVTPYPNKLIAVDMGDPTGPVKWTFEPNPDPTSQGKACCDVVNRGAAYADGKVVYNLLDNNTVAVDANTGKQVWRTKVGDLNKGQTLTMAPLIVHDKVLIGTSGGELGVRGSLIALDLKTGKEVWRAFSTGSDADVRIGADFKPFYTKDQGKDLGLSTWSKDQWQLGGGNIWGWLSYDPELNLFYYGTGNPGVWNPDVRPGDNKWSVTIFARNPDTGMAKWAYQIEAHDAWDYDEIMENVLVDMQWQGRMRKLLIHPGRTGFMFVLDRETGELLSAEKFIESVNWATGYDYKTGKPIEDPAKRTHTGPLTENICPSSTGAKEFVPSSFSPRTGYLYVPGHNTCMSYGGTTATNYIAGTPYLGVTVKMYPGPGGFQGDFFAWDVKNARKVWSIKDAKFPIYSGVLSTAGDVVFYGTMRGEFRAVDARSGEILWEFKAPSGIISNPMTFVGPDGKQYVAMYCGIGGWMGASALPAISEDDPTATLGANGAMTGIKKYTNPGGVIYVFGI